MKGYLGMNAWITNGNGYAGYNRQTVVVGVFYTVLPKL
jgi:hypothetical protein